MTYELNHIYTIEEMKERVERNRAMWFGEENINWTNEEIISYFEKIVGKNLAEIEYYTKRNNENNTIEFYRLVI